MEHELLSLCTDYYAERTRRNLAEHERQIIQKMLQSGLNASNVMDSIDSAVMQCGLDGYGQDYWKAFYSAARAEYARLKTQGLI